MGPAPAYLLIARKAEELFPVQNLPPIFVMSMTQCFRRRTKRFHMAILTRTALRRALLKKLCVYIVTVKASNKRGFCVPGVGLP